jgi:endo-1,4-beta-xylanase
MQLERRERGLKAAFGDYLQIGCALGGTLPGSLTPAEIELVTRHFNVLTPENCMKPGLLQPEPGQFDFAAPDALLGFASQRGMNVVGHTLVWHNQTAPWMYAPGIDPATARGQLESHIRKVVGRYRGKLQGWDVVNEALTDGDGYLRETPCQAAVGSEYLQLAFRFAREADPGVELYYNDYNIELPAKRERTLRLIDQLDAAGERPHGVGIQGHWILDQVPFDEISKALRIYSELGLEVMITELDIDVVQRRDAGADLAGPAQQPALAAACDAYADGCPPEVLQRQAEQYERLFEIFLDRGVSRVTFWGPHDGRSWLNYWPEARTNHPLLFDRQSRPKPAYQRVIAVAERYGALAPWLGSMRTPSYGA